MATKQNSGKATGRHAMETLFPRTFVKGRQAIEDADVVCEDSLQALRCITSKEVKPDPVTGEIKVPDGRTLAIVTKRSAEHYLNRRDCSYYVLCFDNARYVPLTKGEEQSSRDDKAKDRLKYTNEGITPYYDLDQPCIGLDKPLPLDWSLALSDREGFRVEVINWICFQWLMSEDPEVRISVPPGKNLVINGHCLDREQLSEIGIQADTEYDPTLCPIVITGGEGAEIDTIWTDPIMRNCSGEADFQFFFLFRKICELEGRDLSLDIITTDTDLMWFSLLYVDRYHPKKNISWKYAPRGNWSLYRDDPDEENEERVAITQLHDEIVSASFSPSFRPIPKTPQRKRKATDGTHTESKRPEKKAKGIGANPVEVPASQLAKWKTGFKNLKQPIWTLATTAFIAGSDYTTPYFGITHHRIFEALFKFSWYIGDLVTISENYEHGIQLVGSSYLKLVKTAYILSKPRLGKEKPEVTSLEKIRKMTATLSEKNQFPSDRIIKNRALHALHYLKLVFQFDEPELNEPSPLRYAYGPEDPSEPMSRVNITRLQ